MKEIDYEKAKHLADPNCAICNGAGWYTAGHDDGHYDRYCECVVAKTEK